MPSNHLILCHPLLLLPSIFPSIRVFSNESVLPIRWPQYWTFNFSISPSNEYSGLFYFRMDWSTTDLLVVQGILMSLLHHHSWKASMLWHSAFFVVQLSHPHMITGRTIALNIVTIVKKVISLLFNMLSRFVIVFLLLISWLHSPFAVILELKKICHFFTFYFSWSNGTRWCDLSFLECWVLSQVFHSPLSPSPRDFSVPFYFLP